jgi:hypothetical protein
MKNKKAEEEIANSWLEAKERQLVEFIPRILKSEREDNN